MKGELGELEGTKMTSLTVELEDSLYQKLQSVAKSRQLTAAEMVHDLVAQLELPSTTSPGKRLGEIEPFSVGAILRPLSPEDDLMEEMLGDKLF